MKCHERIAELESRLRAEREWSVKQAQLAHALQVDLADSRQLCQAALSELDALRREWRSERDRADSAQGKYEHVHSLETGYIEMIQAMTKALEEIRDEVASPGHGSAHKVGGLARAALGAQGATPC